MMFIDITSTIIVMVIVPTVVVIGLVVYHLIKANKKNKMTSDRKTAVPIKKTREFSLHSSPKFHTDFNAAIEYACLTLDAEKNSLTTGHDLKTGSIRTYLKQVDFNTNIKSLKVTYEEMIEYRTIERYIQRNYQKNAIYSGWKTKSKNILKTFKVNNEFFSNMNNLNYTDNITYFFRKEILAEIRNVITPPKWWKKLVLDDYYRQAYEDFDLWYMTSNDVLEEEVKVAVDSMKYHNIELSLVEKKCEKLYTKIEKLKLKNKTSVKLEMKKQVELEKKESVVLKIKNFNDSIDKANNDIESLKAKKTKYIELFDDTTDKIVNFIDNQEEIISIFEKETHDFVSIKMLKMASNDRFGGCYVIRNNELSKHYVGQSKDVIKRLNQHFAGTKPKQPSFLEDYCNSFWDNKEDLFSVKIIKCSTKDELDDVEKKLIEEYDSFKNGYNKTSGNT